MEENLVGNLESIGEEALIVPISANIAPLAFAEDEHVAFDINPMNS